MLLAIDSTNKGYSVALSDLEKTVFSFQEPDAKSQYLVTDLKRAFEEASVSLDDLKYIVLNTGPGSFTAIRTALTIVNTLQANLDIGLISVNHFELLRFVHRLTKSDGFAFSASEKNPKELFVSLDDDYQNLETNFFTTENQDLELLSMPDDKSCAEYLLDYILAKKDKLDKLVQNSITPYYLREPSLRKAKTNV